MRRLLLVVLLGVLAVLTAAPVALAQEPGQPPADELPQGPQLYQQECSWCHGPNGAGTTRGPSLYGVGAASADYYLRSGRMPLANPRAQSVRQPPRYTEPEIQLLVEYVASLGDGPAVPDLEYAEADLGRGGELFRLNCAPCHNWDGKGGALVDRNAPMLHDITNRQLAAAIRVGPGAMPQFSEDRLDDAELADVVAYTQEMAAPQDPGGWALAHWGPGVEAVATMGALGLLVAASVWAGRRA